MYDLNQETFSKLTKLTNWQIAADRLIAIVKARISHNELIIYITSHIEIQTQQTVRPNTSIFLTYMQNIWYFFLYFACDDLGACVRSFSLLRCISDV